MIVSETLPSDELVQKARGLGLPDHFYNYLELADEEKDDKFPWEKEEEEKKETTPVVEEKTIPKPVFGASTGGAFNFGAKSNGNLSQGLEFCDFWKLVFAITSKISRVPMEYMYRAEK